MYKWGKMGMAKEEMITVGEMALTNKGHVTRPGIGKHFLMNNISRQFNRVLPKSTLCMNSVWFNTSEVSHKNWSIFHKLHLHYIFFLN